MAEGTNRNYGEHESRLDHFRAYTVAHPRLVKAKDALMNAIRGVGKTTLRLKTEQLITSELLNQLQVDRMRIPVASVEAVAPESGSFNWRDHYRRLLHQLCEPLIDYKVNRCPDAGYAQDGARFMPPSRAVGPNIAMRWSRPSAIGGQSPL